MLRLIIDGGLSCVCVWQLRTVCFVVLCKRHRFNRAPGVHRDVVMEEGGGGSNVMAMKDAHRCFAACSLEGQGI